MSDGKIWYKVKGTSGIEGHQFERKLNILFLLRLYTETDDFYFATRIAEADAFDDIVFSYETKGVWSSKFIQIKNTVNISKKALVDTIDKAFHLWRYYKAFKKIEKNPKWSDEHDKIFRDKTRAKFYIYSNGKLYKDVLHPNRKFERVEDKFLSTNDGRDLNIKFDPEKDADLFPDCQSDETTYKDFLTRFSFFTSQGSEKMIDELIDAEIKRIHNMDQLESAFVLSELNKFVNNAQWQTKQEGEVITKKTLKEHFHLSFAQIRSKRNTIVYENSFIDNFCEKICPGSLVVVNNNSECTDMCIDALCQMGYSKTDKNKIFTLKILQDAIVQQHLSRASHIESAIIDSNCDLVGVDLDSIFDFIKKLHASKPKLTIIVVTAKMNSLILSQSVKHNLRTIKFNFTLADVSSDLRNKICCRAISFQGYETSLGSLISEEYGLINMADVSIFNKGQNCIVGNKLPETVSHFIDRELKIDDIVPENRDKIVVLSSAAGTGKTTIMKHRAMKMKQSNREKWVIFIDLAQYIELFDISDSSQMENWETKLKRSFATAAGASLNDLTSRLFQYFYDNPERLIVFIDRFEVIHSYRKQSDDLLTLLNDIGFCQVWIATRPIMQAKLQEHSIVTFNLKMLDGMKQMLLIRKYWSEKHPSLAISVLSKHINWLSKLLQASFDANFNNILKIPKYILMIAQKYDCLNENFEMDGRVIQVQVQNNRLHLIDFLVEENLEIMAKSKIDINTSNYEARLSAKDEHRRFLTRLALLNWLTIEECGQLLPPITESDLRKLKRETEMREEETGLFLCFEGNTPRFIDEIFVHYFVAKFFSGSANRKLFETFSDKHTFDKVERFWNVILGKGIELEMVMDFNPRLTINEYLD